MHLKDLKDNEEVTGFTGAAAEGVAAAQKDLEDGVAYCEIGRYGEGLPLLREAVAGMQRVWGDERHADTKLVASVLEQHEASRAETLRLVQEIFAMFDGDGDGKLSKDEYKAYLRGIGAWGGGSYTDDTWDEKWQKECEGLESGTEGIGWEAFESILYGKYRVGNKAQADLDKCKQSLAEPQPEPEPYFMRRRLGEDYVAPRSRTTMQIPCPDLEPEPEPEPEPEHGESAGKKAARERVMRLSRLDAASTMREWEMCWKWWGGLFSELGFTEEVIADIEKKIDKNSQVKDAMMTLYRKEEAQSTGIRRLQDANWRRNEANRVLETIRIAAGHEDEDPDRGQPRSGSRDDTDDTARPRSVQGGGAGNAVLRKSKRSRTKKKKKSKKNHRKRKSKRTRRKRKSKITRNKRKRKYFL